MQLREWNARLHGLVVFRALLGDPVVAKLAALTDRLEAADDTIAPLCDAVAAFEAALFAHTTNLGDYLSNAVLETETFCVRQAAAGQLSPVMEAALNSELNFLQKLCGLTLDTLLEAADRQSRELAFLPRWEARQLDLTAAYNQRMREAGKKGYGMFAKHHVFTVENGQLVPVKYPDPQKLSELPGYEKEREKVIANTRALLAGSPANNVLLYGDAGTGKSSTVKAIANEYAEVGASYIAEKMKTDEPTIMSSARVPANPFSPSKTKNILLGFLAGFVLACGVVVLRVLLDDTYKSAEEIRKYTGMVVLASVPLVGGTEPKKGSNFQRRMKRLSKDICRRVGGKAGRNA